MLPRRGRSRYKCVSEVLQMIGRRIIRFVTQIGADFSCGVACAAQAQSTVVVPHDVVSAPIVYGGYGGLLDPTFAVTPFGAGSSRLRLRHLLRNRRAGPVRLGPAPQRLCPGYRDAVYQAAAQAVSAPPAETTVAPNVPTGMTATPRNVVARVPHGTRRRQDVEGRPRPIAPRWQGYRGSPPA